MRFLLLLLFLSLAAIPAAEAKGKKTAPVSTELRIENRFEMGFHPVRNTGDDRIHGLSAIDTGGWNGRNKRSSIPPKSKSRYKTKTKKAPEVLGPNDKCFVPEDNITSAQ